MSPLLSYSGRGGRGRSGGRGRGYSGRGGRGGGRYFDAASSQKSHNKSHQWVRAQAENGSSVKQADGKEHQQQQQQRPEKEHISHNDGIKGKNEEVQSTNETHIHNPKHTIMRKHGRNQLILSNKKNPPRSSAMIASTDASTLVVPDQAVMLREGRNKLVAVKAAAASKRKHPPPSSNVAKRQRPQHAKRSAARRIKLSVPTGGAKVDSGQETGSSDEEGRNISNEKQGGCDDESKGVHKTGKLTDFAYKETSRVTQKLPVSKSMHWSKSIRASAAEESADVVERPNAKNRNMGLVRVQPNEKKTPICPTFLRGLQCQNEFCRKRHDVPRDFAMPVCSFFQRHGQCLRDECVFRHVKVNPRAMVCPSFSLLGFCEDDSCTMQHVRRSSKTPHK